MTCPVQILCRTDRSVSLVLFFCLLHRHYFFLNKWLMKEVCTLLLAEGLMGDRMSGLNWMSFAVCVSGIALHLGLKTCYSISKIHSMRLLPIENSPDLELPLLRQKEDEGEETVTEDNDEEQEILL